MRRQITYTDEPISGRPIPDFLPPPEELRRRAKPTKVNGRKIPKIKPGMKRNLGLAPSRKSKAS